MLSGVSAADTATKMLGAPVSMPVGLAPAALQRLAHPEGELAAARAAARAGAIFCLSTLSSYSIEDVAQATSGDWWFQLYVQKDRGISAELVRRAAWAGCRAIVLTVDVPIPGYRERELRGGVRLPDHRPGNLDGRSLQDESLLGHIARSFDSSLSWGDVGWVRSLCPLPLVIKGILTAEDALLAAEHGASAIVVSNHGGRQLDRSPASLDVLEEVAGAVGDRVEIYLDGGVRRGSDVLIALALGATAVFVGRPYLFALAAGGEEGVLRALSLVAAELENAMVLLGIPDLGSLSRSHVL